MNYERREERKERKIGAMVGEKGMLLMKGNR